MEDNKKTLMEDFENPKPSLNTLNESICASIV